MRYIKQNQNHSNCSGDVYKWHKCIFLSFVVICNWDGNKVMQNQVTWFTMLQRLTCDVIRGMFEILKRSQSRHRVGFIDTCLYRKFKLNSHHIVIFCFLCVVLNKCLLLCNLSYSCDKNTPITSCYHWLVFIES